MRILLVEDDFSLSEMLKTALSNQAHTVDHIDDGLMAHKLLKTEEYDAVVLDLSLPNMDGIDILKKARASGNHVPIIILTARREVQSRVLALNNGADDYLIKPFDISELEARLGAIFRRSMMQDKATIEIGNFSFDSAAHRVFVNNEEIHIPKRELSLLECLLNRQGKVVSKDIILERIYSLEEDADTQVIDLYIHRLRKRLKNATSIKIKTLRGLGFLLDTQS
ncbi:MAG: response regulator [Cellvibrionaceae bacterium]